MATSDERPCAVTDDEIVEAAQPAIASRSQHDIQHSRNKICFAPAEQAHNHGSDRLRPLRTMPFDLETWIGDFDHLRDRVWPHPSYSELLARFLTRDPRFPLPDIVAKDDRLQNLRLRCCGEGCSPTSQNPFVEYEKPSRLEKLSFESAGDVIIYPFYVRLSKETGLQKLFAIVHRRENGEYGFWKADGAHHGSYGLSKGNVSVFKSPRSAHSTNIGTLGSPKKDPSTREVAIRRQRGAEDLDDPDDVPLQTMSKTRTLAPAGVLEEQHMGGQDVGLSKSHSKKRPLADPVEPTPKKHHVPTKVFHGEAPEAFKAVPKKHNSNLSNKTPTGRLNEVTCLTYKPNRSLLHIKEVCMLAYYLTGQGLKLLYRTNAFTIESGQGSLIDPTNGVSFRITEDHALYVLYSRQSSFKVILSESTTHDINKTEDDMTGGIILLEFGGESARDEFMARIREMVGTSAGGISCADDFVIESMYGKLMQQLNNRRSDLKDSQNDDESTVRETIEKPKSILVESPRNPEEAKAPSCPAAIIKPSPSHVSETPVDPNTSALPITPVSLRPSPKHRSAGTVPFANGLSTVSGCPAIASAAPFEKTREIVQPSPDVPNNEDAMKKELSNLLRDTYIKYPSAQDDDEVETMALLLKAPLLAGDKARVRELKMDLKVYLIAHHG